MSKKVVVIIGAPGSGKGFYSQWISKNYHFSYIGSGDLCRRYAKKETALGRKIKNIIDQGQLVQPDLITELISQEFKVVKHNFVLDGFPRNLKQFDNWRYLIKDKKWIIIYLILNCDLKLCQERINDRLVCPFCNAIYNRKTHPPQELFYCDFDQSPLTLRDDAKETSKRFLVFENETKPLIDYLLKNNKVFSYQLDAGLPLSINRKKLIEILDLKNDE